MGRSSPGTYSHTSSLQPPIKLHVLKLHGHNKMELEILPRVRVATRDDDDDDVGTLNQSGTSLFILVAVAPESESNTLSLHDFHLGHDGTMVVIGNQLLWHDLPVHFPAALLHLRTIMHLCHRFQNLEPQDSPYTSESCIYCELDSSKTPRADRPANLNQPLDSSSKVPPSKHSPTQILSLSLSLHPQTQTSPPTTTTTLPTTPRSGTQSLQPPRPHLSNFFVFSPLRPPLHSLAHS